MKSLFYQLTSHLLANWSGISSSAGEEKALGSSHQETDNNRFVTHEKQKIKRAEVKIEKSVLRESNYSRWVSGDEQIHKSGSYSVCISSTRHATIIITIITTTAERRKDDGTARGGVNNIQTRTEEEQSNESPEQWREETKDLKDDRAEIETTWNQTS